jgi:hypothetical protein
MLLFSIVIVVLVGIATTVDGFFMALPREFHKVHPKLIWVIVTSGVMTIAASFLVRTMPPVAGILLLVAVSIFALIRAVSFFGLNASFRAYSRENGVYLVPAGTALTWFAALLDMTGVSVIVISAFLHSIQYGPLTFLEEKDYARFSLVILAGGLFVTIAFLLAMSSNKSKVIEFERTERKKKLDELLVARKMQRSADAARSK